MQRPELFGPYLLHHLQAQGTTSDVYLAQTTGDFPRLCAVKCIRPEVAALPGFASRFREDAALLVRLIHGNLVQILEVGAVEERLFVAMEQIDGVDLMTLIAQSSVQEDLPPEFAYYVGLEMCEAVMYIHHHRCAVQGTLSFPYDAPWPLEVMISVDGVVKIVDLGSFGAIHLGQQKISKLFQCPGYAVPEVIKRRPIDMRSNLFSIGLVIWEILEGRRLVADNPEHYIRQVLEDKWEAPLIQRQDVSGDVIRLVASMLKLQPEKRPKGIESVRHRLVEALRHTSPAYGSAGVSHLLSQRCQTILNRSEHLIRETIARAKTERGRPHNVTTRTFSRAGSVNRHVNKPLPLRVGDRIPGTRYRLVRLVGKGGSAEVYAAQHIDLDRQVAIKILSSKLAGNAEAIAHFRLEARACSRVGHPNIVEVIDFGELEDGRFYFAMELLDGKSLADLLDEQNVLPVEQAIGIFRQIAKALQKTHEHGIIHRDLKPENVMLIQKDNQEDFVKLLDFGVMAFRTDTTGEAVGTPGYMAPEQVFGASPTPAMDIYAVGATLYEALSGEPPYPADSYEEFVEAQATKAPPALRSKSAASHLHEGFERVVHRALSWDTNARHPSMADFEMDLLKAQQEAGIKTRWDDLPPPTGMHDLRIKLRTAPLTKRKSRVSSRIVLLSVVVAIVGLSLGAYRFIFPTHSANKQKQHVEIPQSHTSAAALKVKPAPALLEARLKEVEEAAAQGLFTHPEGRSAWDLLKHIDEEFKGNHRTKEFRLRLARSLEGAADRLFSAGLKQAARTLYQEALLFAPDSSKLWQLSALEPKKTSPKKLKRPASQMSDVAWLLSQVQLSVAEGHYLSPKGKNALYFLHALKRIDPTGKHTARAQEIMASLLRKQADHLWGKSKVEKAQALYRVILTIDPQDAKAKKRMQGKREKRSPAAISKSVQKKREAVSIDPQLSARLVKEGNQLMRRGKILEAQGRFRAAVAANPKDSKAVFGLATTAFEQAHYLKAVEYAKQTLVLDRKDVSAHLLLGDAYFKLLRHPEAKAAWEEVLKLDRRNLRAQKRLNRLRTRAE